MKSIKSTLIILAVVLLMASVGVSYAYGQEEDNPDRIDKEIRREQREEQRQEQRQGRIHSIEEFIDSVARLNSFYFLATSTTSTSSTSRKTPNPTPNSITTSGTTTSAVSTASSTPMLGGINQTQQVPRQSPRPLRQLATPVSGSFLSLHSPGDPFGMYYGDSGFSDGMTRGLLIIALSSALSGLLLIILKKSGARFTSTL